MLSDGVRRGVGRGAVRGGGGARCVRVWRSALIDREVNQGVYVEEARNLHRLRVLPVDQSAAAKEPKEAQRWEAARMQTGNKGARTSSPQTRSSPAGGLRRHAPWPSRTTAAALAEPQAARGSSCLPAPICWSSGGGPITTCTTPRPLAGRGRRRGRLQVSERAGARRGQLFKRPIQPRDVRQRPALFLSRGVHKGSFRSRHACARVSSRATFTVETHMHSRSVKNGARRALSPAARRSRCPTARARWETAGRPARTPSARRCGRRPLRWWP